MTRPGAMERPLPTDSDRQTQPSGTLTSIFGKCPRCGAPIEVGFAVAGTWMNWVKKEGILDGNLFHDDKLVRYGDAIIPAHIPAVRCRGCGLVVLDLSRMR
jgi:hypothetical protein